MQLHKDYLEEWSEKLKAIAHPERLAILKLLCNCSPQQMSVSELYTKLELSQPTVSKHLSILKRSGICQRKAVGVKTYYLLTDKAIGNMIKAITNEKKN